MTDTETTDKQPKDSALAARHGYIDDETLDKIPDDETRQQVKDRLASLYRSQKETAQALNEARTLYSNMEKRLAEMEAGTRKAKAETELASIRKGIEDSNAKGDYKKASELTERLVDLKAATKPKESPRETPRDELSKENFNALIDWRDEVTDDGRFKRPWARPTHPRQQEAVMLLDQLTADPEYRAKGFLAMLQEVDRRMAPKPKQESPVASGDTTVPRRAKTTELSESQKRVATKLYPHLSREKAIEAYTEANKKWGA